MSSVWQKGGQAGQWWARTALFVEDILVYRLIEEVHFEFGALGKDVWVGGSALGLVHILHLDGDTEVLGQCNDVNVVTCLAHGLHLLLKELLEPPPTCLHEVLEELVFLLQ